MSSFLIFIVVLGAHMEQKAWEFPDLAACSAAAQDVRADLKTAKKPEGATIAVFCSPSPNPAINQAAPIGPLEAPRKVPTKGSL